MAEEKNAAEQDGEQDSPKPAQKKSKKRLYIFIGIGVALSFLVGVALYVFVFGGSVFSIGKSGPAATAAKAEKQKSVLFPLDPFVLNLSEKGRFLKVSVQLEYFDPGLQESLKEKTPQLRDAIITLVSYKPIDSLSSPEGKFLLKDEILLRANQVMGKDVFKNLYFTEFIMQ